ncbi:hypothetical protein TNCV_5097301 [Trichonephila clavipes]|nr:hypothetical protein TNCV_5097301 [Trichonephila clavipes]
MADKLSKECCNLPTPAKSTLTYLELYSLKKSQNLVECRVPPIHHWYVGNRPGLVLALKCDKCSHSLVLLVVTSSALHSQQTNRFPFV